MAAPADPTLDALERGPLHRFADFPTLTDLPRTGAAIYTIWDDAGALIYVGVSGRSTTSRKGPRGPAAKSLERPAKWRPALRLPRRSLRPASAHPGGGVDAISSAEPTLYMDDFIAAVVRERFSFRIAVAPDYATALATEAAIKAGGLAAGSPRLNPAQYRRRTQKRVGFTAR